MTARDHVVYRAFDAEGNCLYVGCTGDLRARRATHQKSSLWYPLAKSCVLTGPMDANSAYELELREIKRLDPAFNQYGRAFPMPPLTTTPGKLLGSREACDRLGINRSTITRWVKNDQLVPAGKMNGKNGHLLFHEADIDHLVKARTGRSVTRIA